MTQDQQLLKAQLIASLYTRAATGKQPVNLATDHPAPAMQPQEDAPKEEEQSVLKEETNASDQPVAQLNDHIQTVERKLHFSHDDTTGETVTLVRDDNNNIIRTIPDEASEYLNDQLHKLAPLNVFEFSI